MDDDITPEQWQQFAASATRMYEGMRAVQLVIPRLVSGLIELRAEAEDIILRTQGEPRSQEIAEACMARRLRR